MMNSNSLKEFPFDRWVGNVRVEQSSSSVSSQFYNAGGQLGKPYDPKDETISGALAERGLVGVFAPTAGDARNWKEIVEKQGWAALKRRNFPIHLQKPKAAPSPS